MIVYCRVQSKRHDYFKLNIKGIAKEIEKRELE
jgi:hypothetical protein